MKIGYLMQQGVDIRKSPFNGPANHVREVIQELENLGHEVQVVFRLDGQTWTSTDLKTFAPINIPWLDQGPLRWIEKLVRRIQYELQLPYFAFFESLRFALGCKKILSQCDLLYERFSWMGYGGALASRWLKIPIIIEDNGDHLSDLEAKGIAPQGNQRKFSIALTKRAVQKAAHIVSSGDGWRMQFIRRWGIPDNKITVVENGTIVPDLLTREMLQSFRESQAAQKIPTLVYVGGFYPWHGVPILLRAFSRVREAGVMAQLILIGSGSGEVEAKQLAEKLELGKSVSFSGHLSPHEFTPILANADIGLSPYCGWPEYSGLKIFDYKAAGLAVIASGELGMPTTLKNGETGWIVPPCDEEALTSAILKLATNLDLAWEMGRKGRQEAEKFHKWEHTAKNLESIFCSIINNKDNYD